MANIAHFQVDPRLASVLGENYRSTEQALKELVDNAWDADAENVWIDLPELLSGSPIAIRDDGSGMTESEVRHEYLSIASGRRTRKGEETPRKHRRVKGRRGIGKFAGLVAADAMTVETKARGILTRLTVAKDDLLEGSVDLELVDLPLESEPCDTNDHGTSIILTKLKQKRSLPTPATLRQLLVLEYGRERGFTIHVNGEKLSMEDIPGRSFSSNADLSDAGGVTLKFKIADGSKAVRNPGISLRVGDRIVGQPGFFGLEDREDIPARLLKKVYGEIEAPALEPFVTADWAAVLENSTAFQQVQELVKDTVGARIEKVFARDIKLAQAHLKPEIDKRLERIPENRRELARAALDRVMRRFYGESPERIAILVDVVLDAFEKDEYWQVCQKIKEARFGEIVALAEALDTFGFVQMAAMANHACRRLDVLDGLDELTRNPETLEKDVHKALEKNLWVFGPEYSLMASNRSLDRIVAECLDRRYTGDRANKRPDLLLAQNTSDFFLLIEFKRPSHILDRNDEAQAAQYRDDIQPFCPTNARIDVLLVGHKREAKGQPQYDSQNTRYTSYSAMLSTARNQLNWLLNELTQNCPPIS